MRLRAILVLQAGNIMPAVIRHFPSVEDRCKATMDEYYTAIPPEKIFVTHVLSALENPSADIVKSSKCSMIVMYPTFELSVKNGILWPLVVTDVNGIIYCALPLITKQEFLNRNSLVDMPCVSQTIQIIQGMAACVNEKYGKRVETSKLIAVLTHYINISMPFGRAVLSNSHVAYNLCHTTAKSKLKSAVWNPVTHKGKSDITLSITEFIDCIQFNSPEAKPVTRVYGTLFSAVKAEGFLPEVSFLLYHPACKYDDIIVSSMTTSIEKENENMTHVRFQGCGNRELCHYLISDLFEPPVFGEFKASIVNNVATLHLKLSLKKTVKNSFIQMEVHIPFFDLIISGLKCKATVGSASTSGKNMLLWDIGTKFPSNTLAAELNAVVRFNKEKLRFHDPLQNEVYQNNLYAMIKFKINGYSYSGTKVDPHSIDLSAAVKKRCSVTQEFVSGIYQTLNNIEEEIHNSSLLDGALRNCLHNSTVQICAGK